MTTKRSTAPSKASRKKGSKKRGSTPRKSAGKKASKKRASRTRTAIQRTSLQKLLERKTGCSVSQAAKKLSVSEPNVRSIIGTLRRSGSKVKSLGGGVFKL